MSLVCEWVALETRMPNLVKTHNFGLKLENSTNMSGFGEKALLFPYLPLLRTTLFENAYPFRSFSKA